MDNSDKSTAQLKFEEIIFLMMLFILLTLTVIMKLFNARGNRRNENQQKN